MHDLPGRTIADHPDATKSTGAALHQAGVCNVAGALFLASPAQLAAGAAGQFGANGPNGAAWVLQCTGELDINGGVSVIGQSGGPGGAGTSNSAVAAVATGGNGGAGGTIKVRANNGNLVLSGTGNNIQEWRRRLRRQAATATATQQGDPEAGSASATAGNGAQPGLIVLQAKGGGITINTALNLTIGKGGNGGVATATAANGQNATPCNGGVGGAATATGGAGGATPDKQLTATGAVGGVGNVTVAGGNPGVGGNAIARPPATAAWAPPRRASPAARAAPSPPTAATAVTLSSRTPPVRWSPTAATAARRNGAAQAAETAGATAPAYRIA